MRNLIIIEAPSNLGLKSLQPGIEPGVRHLPEALRKTGFADSAGIQQCIQVPAPPYNMDSDQVIKIRNAATIAAYSLTLGKHVQEAIERDLVPVVIGGDCSILIGNAVGLKNMGTYGLFYIDGHTDYMLPQHSGTEGAAGMDLALITGNGPAVLSDIGQQGPYIKEEHVYAYGNRDMVDWYVDLVKESGINYYDLPTIREQGIENITADFLKMIDRQQLDGFWIHFDVDALDNEIMPCVDSPQEDGLSYEELSHTLQPLLASPSFRGINITILDPSLDPQLKYTQVFSAQLGALLKRVVSGINL